MNNAVLSFEEYKNNNNNRNKNDSSSCSSYSSYYRHGAGRVDEHIAQVYQQEIGTFMSGSVILQITQWINDGISEDSIISAITITGQAQRPSFPYLRAVMNDWIQRGLVIYNE